MGGGAFYHITNFMKWTGSANKRVHESLWFEPLISQFMPTPSFDTEEIHFYIKLTCLLFSKKKKKKALCCKGNCKSRIHHPSPEFVSTLVCKYNIRRNVWSLGSPAKNVHFFALPRISAQRIVADVTSFTVDCAWSDWVQLKFKDCAVMKYSTVTVCFAQTL